MAKGANKQDGYVKYSCDWTKTDPIRSDAMEGLIGWRQRLFGLGLIGMYPDGVGFGNISARSRPGSREFLITGTKTGGVEVMTSEHVTEVTDVDFAKNYVACRGPVEASSEAMTHEAVYLSDARINAVAHVHSKAMWDRYLHKVPTTSKDAAYGTPEMAREVLRLFKEDKRIWDARLIVMEGHEEGLVSFGRTMDDAGDAMIAAFEAFKRSTPG